MRLEPDAGGHWQWLGSTTLAYRGAALRPATQYAVAVSHDLTDYTGAGLDRDYQIQLYHAAARCRRHPPGDRYQVRRPARSAGDHLQQPGGPRVGRGRVSSGARRAGRVHLGGRQPRGHLHVERAAARRHGRARQCRRGQAGRGWRGHGRAVRLDLPHQSTPARHRFQSGRRRPGRAGGQRDRRALQRAGEQHCRRATRGCAHRPASHGRRRLFLRWRRHAHAFRRPRSVHRLHRHRGRGRRLPGPRRPARARLHLALPHRPAQTRRPRAEQRWPGQLLRRPAHARLRQRRQRGQLPAPAPLAPQQRRAGALSHARARSPRRIPAHDGRGAHLGPARQLPARPAPEPQSLRRAGRGVRPAAARLLLPARLHARDR